MGRSPAFLNCVLLGDNLLPLLTLALGAALVVGNAAALLRPPASRREGDLPQAPLGRTILQMAIGLVAAVWALASLMG